MHYVVDCELLRVKMCDGTVLRKKQGTQEQTRLFFRIDEYTEQYYIEMIKNKSDGTQEVTYINQAYVERMTVVSESSLHTKPIPISSKSNLREIR